MAASSHAPPSDAERWSPVPERPYVQAAAQVGADPDAVRAALDDLDATCRRREQRRRAATRELVAELYERDGLDPAPDRVDAEAEAACAQEHDERLAAELRRLVTPPVAAVRRARTLGDAELDGACQAAISVLATAPRSLAEFGPDAERRHAAERALLDHFATLEAQTARRLARARGWQLRRRGRLRRALAEASRSRQAAAHRVHAAAAGLAAVQLRAAQRAQWLARPNVEEVLGVGAAALRELADRAQLGETASTVELPAVAPPMAPGATR
jgi:hypothetical protein